MTLISFVPRYCIVCGEFIADSVPDSIPVCHRCRRALRPFPGQTCPICGLPADLSGEICESCAERTSPIEKIRTAYLYRAGAARIVKAYKSYGHRHFSALFREELTRIYRQEYHGLPLVPVPASRHGRRKRGFDQSLELAQMISSATGEAVWDGLSRRSGDEQKTLSRSERLQNLSDAFFLRRANPPEEIVLVDDVITTGATVEQCARLLRQHGTKRCFVLALARDV